MVHCPNRRFCNNCQCHARTVIRNGDPPGGDMHTVTISREGLLRFGFSELERPSWRLKNATTLYEVQPIQPRLYSLKLPKNNIRPYSLKSRQQENVNSDMGAANAPLSIRGRAMPTVLSALFTFREIRLHWRNLQNTEKNGMHLKSARPNTLPWRMILSPVAKCLICLLPGFVNSTQKQITSSK